MRLKEIKPGMSIRCKNNDEKKELLKEAERLGYVWYYTKDKPTENLFSGNTINFYDADAIDCYKNITQTEERGRSIAEFSDLILPEMTVEEVLRIRNELSFDFVREYLGLCYGRSLDEMLRMATVEQIIDMCEKWKSEHEKKEPETEWMWQGRIVNANNMELLQCFDTGCEYRESAEEYMKDELKEYCKTHDGEFIATVEHICRVKK